MGANKTDIPSDRLILELLQHTPVVLLLDEFQTWYDGLTDTKQRWVFVTPEPTAYCKNILQIYIRKIT